jgi:hypothetical protein
MNQGDIPVAAHGLMEEWRSYHFDYFEVHGIEHLLG